MFRIPYTELYTALSYRNYWMELKVDTISVPFPFMYLCVCVSVAVCAMYKYGWESVSYDDNDGECNDGGGALLEHSPTLLSSFLCVWAKLLI